MYVARDPNPPRPRHILLHQGNQVHHGCGLVADVVDFIIFIGSISSYLGCTQKKTCILSGAFRLEIKVLKKLDVLK